MSKNQPCWNMAENGKEHEWDLSDCPYCRIEELEHKLAAAQVAADAAALTEKQVDRVVNEKTKE